jgi:DNA-binding CsgD family transcriptional regulator
MGYTDPPRARDTETHLMKKLDLHNAAELTAFAVDKGLVAR